MQKLLPHLLCFVVKPDFWCLTVLKGSKSKCLISIWWHELVKWSFAWFPQKAKSQNNISIIVHGSLKLQRGSFGVATTQPWFLKSIFREDSASHTIALLPSLKTHNREKVSSLTDISKAFGNQPSLEMMTRRCPIFLGDKYSKTE